MVWLWILIAVLLISLLIFVGFPMYMFHFVFYRPKRSTKVPKFYVGTPHYNVSRAGMKYMETLEVKDLYIQSRDNLKLHARLYLSEKPSNKYIIGIHGYKSYARPEFGPYIKFYHELGFNMILPDDRAHAPSEGKYIGFGVLDRLDCVDWAKYTVKTYGEDTEIYLHGVSMGGATVLSASGEEDLPKQVKGIISDCGFTSAKAALTYELKEVMHLPANPTLSICEKICKRRAGFDFTKYSAIEQVKNAKVPILFVQGKKDQMVPYFMSEELYNACPTKKKLLTVEEAGHAESIALAPDEYHKAIHELFGI